MSAVSRVQSPEPADFRKAMGSFAAGVTVVTGCHEGRLVGTTVSAFSSVSMDPPLVMVCLKRDSRTLAALSQTKAFCVNILAQEQGDLAYRFAKSGATCSKNPPAEILISSRMFWISASSRRSVIRATTTCRRTSRPVASTLIPRRLMHRQ